MGPALQQLKLSAVLYSKHVICSSEAAQVLLSWNNIYGIYPDNVCRRSVWISLFSVAAGVIQLMEDTNEKFNLNLQARKHTQLLLNTYVSSSIYS